MNAKNDIRTEVHFRESTVTKSYQYIDTTDKNVVKKKATFFYKFGP
jgi:hypothetical protein